MKKILAWMLNKTKMGSGVEKVRKVVDGKKQMLASLSIALVSTLTIVAKFGEGGSEYLMSIAHTPEFASFSMGWIGFFNALKGEKIRAENAEIIRNQGKD